MRTVRIKTDVSTEPVSAAEAKLFCKVTGTSEDALFPLFIRAARESIERFTNTSLAQKTLIAEWDKLPRDGIITLPYGPISSTALVVKTIDEESVEDTLTLNSEYYVMGLPWPKLRIGSIWSTRSTRLQIEYVAGYGATGCPVLPAQLKVAIMKEILSQYDIRENLNVNNVGGELSNSARVLAAPYIKEIWLGAER